ncbi:hypothetical protein LEP1GSC049_3581 [Leptospira kirschneri serovar Cynopteri str. 3522 CT]|nr:hypothetical protein LEP1GSC064_1590 [Leptospira kirschneri serovar Grippotyphosa str. Moskva]EKR06852.1 hypothetical protein LEP1GSC122_0990 [Leptospira kirschneri serovar Valbuzzi str. 200702274]EMK19467.1 hypothetical protein LEP1GSC042_1585 [Leptospira kirschneri serovar Bim str. PUO 1247]EMN05443.1 hypothetical protein LEP1GSC046_2106 [Leptospira kirschneri serovar Bim str. 1051]EPG50491.1 hypothetical protein LEP1GSC049_3581 [Leptospira kirschneri serovar Cynopteri str. 3522 CT]
MICKIFQFSKMWELSQNLETIVSISLINRREYLSLTS